MITMVGTGGKVTELSGVSDMPASLSGTIIIESATRPELKRLADAYALNYGNLCDALDINEAPRLEHRDDYDYLYEKILTKVQPGYAYVEISLCFNVYPLAGSLL